MSRNPLEGWPDRAEAQVIPPIPAATVVLLRDAPGGVETLMLRRNQRLDFAGGMWVFPGGRVDPVDVDPAAPDDHEATARRAAAREAAEEAALVVDPHALHWFAHWVPPPVTPKRFATYFFVGRAPDGAVTVDGGEIHDHVWVRPADALAARDRGEVQIVPPTWVTLHTIVEFATVDDALTSLAAREPEYFETHIARLTEGGMVALWEGDVAYASLETESEGPRHRLWMVDDGWRYERT